MPLLRLETSVALTDDTRKALLASLSKAMAETIGKPEQYVMITVSPAAIRMSGQDGAAAFAEIRSIGGLNEAVNRRLSQRVCKLLTESLGLAPDRVYLNFAEVKAANWGWNGGTFAAGGS